MKYFQIVVIVCLIFSIILFTGCKKESKQTNSPDLNQTTAETTVLQKDISDNTTKNIDATDNMIKPIPATIDGNLINYGNSAEYKDSIYFCNNGIYRMEKDRDGLKQICDDGGNFLNVIDDWIYFTTQNSVCKVKIDGSDKKIVFTKDSEYPFMWLKVEDNNIYFYCKNQLIKMDLEGKYSEVLLTEDNLSSFDLTNGVLFYQIFDMKSNKGSILSFDLKTKQESIIKSGIDGLYSLLVSNGYIYYLDRYSNEDLSKRLCKINKLSLDGKSSELIYSINQNVHDMNIDQNWIYFVREDDKYYELICKVSLANKGFEVVLPFTPSYRMLNNNS